MQSQELADISAFYRAFGLEISEGTERHDHISVELEFMGYLFFKEAYGKEKGHSAEKVALVQDGQRRFLKEHIGRWVPLFCRLLRKKGGDSFYGALANFTSIFIKKDMEVMGVQAKEWGEPIRVTENLEPDNSCFGGI
jgi:TorA maturation chaperone TorD